MRVNRRRIPDPLYKKIVEAMPIPCADAVIVHARKFLLGKRVNKPLRGGWCVIGGRVLKGEGLEDAIRRHVKREAGITRLKIKRFITTKGVFFRNSEQGPAAHDICSVFLVEVPSLIVSLRNGENSELRWFSKIDKKWHPYVKEVLQLSGFK